MFFTFFQFYFNILAELTYFGDRQFYREWWNCRDLADYWRLWNLPVHHWFVRHMHNPMIKRFFPQELSGTLVFLVSAIAHEYLISVAMGHLSYWSFLGMIVQSVAISAEKFFLKAFKLKESQFGNFSFWVSFCIVGQPALVLAYYAEYIKTFGLPALPITGEMPPH